MEGHRITDNAPQCNAVASEIEYTPTESQMFDMWLEDNHMYFEGFDINFDDLDVD